MWARPPRQSLCFLCQTDIARDATVTVAPERLYAESVRSHPCSATQAIAAESEPTAIIPNQGSTIMPRYWVIAPVESKPPELFDRVWEFDLANNCISIGWSGLGDISQLSKEAIAAKIAIALPDKPASTQSLFTNMNWSFFHEIAPGDMIIARRGRKILAAVGRVTSRAVFSPGKSPVHNHSHFIQVD